MTSAPSPKTKANILKVTRMLRKTLKYVSVDPVTRAIIIAALDSADALAQQDQSAAALPLSHAVLTLSKEKGDVEVAQALYGEPDAKTALRDLSDFYGRLYGTASPAATALSNIAATLEAKGF